MPHLQRVALGALFVLAAAAPSGVMAASTTTYTYDVFGQLTVASSSAGRTATYTYDVAGNRTNITASGAIAISAPVDPRSEGVTIQAEASHIESPAAQGPTQDQGDARLRRQADNRTAGLSAVRALR
jgi:YD repeat-containing protein